MAWVGVNPEQLGVAHPHPPSPNIAAFLPDTCWKFGGSPEERVLGACPRPPATDLSRHSLKGDTIGAQVTEEEVRGRGVRWVSMVSTEQKLSCRSSWPVRIQGHSEDACKAAVARRGENGRAQMLSSQDSRDFKRRLDTATFCSPRELLLKRMMGLGGMVEVGASGEI